jgi:Tfp pilus assembly protein PilF
MHLFDMALLLLALSLFGDPAPPPAADPARAPLERAYAALRARDYDQAITWFRAAREIDPKRPATHQDLAYTLLKTGETETARDEFQEAMRLDPANHRVALEYAFLCYETKRRAEARRAFDRVRKLGDPESRATAERAFANVDRPLAEGIVRWTEAIRRSPENFSAHEELARIAEERDDFELAARQYKEAIRLKPENRSLWLELGRVLKAMGREEEANQAFEQALQGPQPRAAETARSLLPRERASAAPPGEPAPAVSAREMADRSYRASYLKDALRYYRAAVESNPLDYESMLGLARTYNVLKQDGEAVRWFGLARRSPDPAVSGPAGESWSRLKRSASHVRTTLWLLPFYSSRWHDVFAYSQAKTEVRIGKLPFRPYLSARFIGDTRRSTREVVPQYLSESSALAAVGLATDSWHGAVLWAEAGSAISYLSGRRRMMPDYRGGLAWSRGFGRMLGGESGGAFAQTGVDGVFLSRFHNDVLVYLQNRFGYTFAPNLQLYWNLNLTGDTRREPWANFVEAGPGLRVRTPGMPKSLSFSVNVVRGSHWQGRSEMLKPDFVDVRAGFWYAITR